MMNPSILIEPKPHDLPAPLVVSLTSYPKRYGVLEHTLNCLQNQTVKPDKIVLWVAREDKDQLPANVVAMNKRGISIRTCEDIKSYKKIIPSLKAYPDAFIATADDDVYLDRHWLSDMTETWKRAGGIICTRAHGIRQDQKGRLLPYNDWAYEVKGPMTSARLFPTTGLGVLYPPKALPEETTDKKLFMSLAPVADDVWMYFMDLRGGNNITLIDVPRALVMWEDSQNTRLWNLNMNGGNDNAIRAMVKAFGLPAAFQKDETTFSKDCMTVNKMLATNPCAYG